MSDSREDNLLVALEWTLQHGDTEAALHIVRALGPFWRRRGEYREGRHWIEAALTRDPAAPATIRAHTLYEAGMLAAEQGDYQAAETHFVQSLQLCHSIQNGHGASNALAGLGQVALAQGEYALARSRFEASLALRETLGDQRVVAHALINLALVALVERECEVAQGLVSRSLDLQRDIEDALGMVQSVVLLGEVARCQDDYAQAGDWYAQCLELAREVGDAETMAWALHNQGYVARHEGDLDGAWCLFTDSLTLFQRQEHLVGPLACLAGLAGVLAAGGQPELAARLLGHVQSQLARLNYRLPPADQKEFDRTLTQVRTHLDDATLTAALAVGQHLSFDRLLAEALASRSTLSSTTDQSPRLCIFALGQGRVLVDDHELTRGDWRYSKAQELFFYMVTEGPRTKAEIGLALWPDASPAQLRRHLHRTLHALRSALGRPDWVLVQDDHYTFNRDLRYWFDVEALEEAMQVAPRIALDALTAVLSLYQGDFLSDLDAGEWAMVKREELRRCYLDALLTLGQRLFDAGEYAQAADIYRRAVTLDGYLEEAHRGLMRCLARQGETAQAIRHYQSLVEHLRTELNARPSEETRLLYKELQRDV